MYKSSIFLHCLLIKKDFKLIKISIFSQKNKQETSVATAFVYTLYMYSIILRMLYVDSLHNSTKNLNISQNHISPHICE